MDSNRKSFCMSDGITDLVYFKIIRDGQPINIKVCSIQLKLINEVLSGKCLGLVNSKLVVFQQNNAKPKTAKVTRNTI